VAPVVAPVASARPSEEAALARRNRRRALGIAAVPGVLALIVVGAVLGALVGPLVGLVAGVVAALAAWSGTWWGATSLVVRALHAEPADEDDYARVFNLVDGLCATMGLAVPSLCIVSDDARGALVLGRRRRTAVLIVTTGMVEALDPVQLEAVLAHELMHVKCGDIMPATVAAGMTLPLVALLPGASGLVHALAGRGREFRTDRWAVGVTRYPPGLRDALAILAEGPVSAPSSPLAGRGVAAVTRWLWTVPLAMADGHRPGTGVPGELDAAGVRIAALDEW
jgi:Zn-dependent protease with chaperone function